ncbi:MAG: BatA domain-containing protein [Pedobacter sp.]|nr:BatA domain-containing protein [Pedobacter sp.]
MNLVYPIGLLALVGLTIPVLLHLWSVKRGKTLKIGSIALLGESATVSSKSFKLTDLLLFVLRCLILILIALILSQPYFKKTSLISKNKGWILIDKTIFGAVYETHRKPIDSLLNLGFELHDFNLGFDLFFLKDSIAHNETSAKLSYNTLINQLTKKMPSGYAAHVFANLRLNNFEGNLSKPNFSLTWHYTQNRDSLKTWSTKFLDKVYEGVSTPSLTYYTANPSQDLSVIRVSIYDPKGEDSGYIKAALNSIADFTQRKIEINKSSSKADVVFWLSDQPVAMTANTIFSYQKGKIEAVNSTLQVSAEPNQLIELKKRVVLDSLKGSAIWTDGYGQPVLIKQNGTHHFHFYSHFDPLWSDLVWSDQFVKALIPIVLGNQTAEDFGFETHDADQRVIDKMQFVDVKIKTSGVSATTTNQSLALTIWFLAFLLLLMERVLSFRRKTNLHDVKS